MLRLIRAVLSAALVAAAVPVALLPAPQAQALDNGLARTPQLGWNDWNSFGCNVNDRLIRQTADAMVSSGMAAAGYSTSTSTTAGRQRSRDGSGNLVPDPRQVPQRHEGSSPTTCTARG